jgi:hypothetical protein
VPENRLLEGLRIAERAARQGPGAFVGRLGPLPQKHLQAALSHPQDDGERDMRARIDHEF